MLIRTERAKFFSLNVLIKYKCLLGVKSQKHPEIFYHLSGYQLTQLYWQVKYTKTNQYIVFLKKRRLKDSLNLEFANIMGLILIL